MTTITILSEEEIQVFENPPRFIAEERKHYFTLPDWAEELVASLTTTTSKICCVLQLVYFRATAKFYPKNLFYLEDSAFVQKRLGISTIWQEAQYAKRTKRRHRTIILTKLNYTAFSPTVSTTLSAEAESAVEKQMRTKDVVSSLLEFLDRKQIEEPGYHTLSTLITHVFRQYEKRMLTRLAACLTDDDKQLLDTLLIQTVL